MLSGLLLSFPELAAGTLSWEPPFQPSKDRCLQGGRPPKAQWKWLLTPLIYKGWEVDEISVFVIVGKGREGAGLVLLPSSGKEDSRQLLIELEGKRVSWHLAPLLRVPWAKEERGHGAERQSNDTARGWARPTPRVAQSPDVWKMVLPILAVPRVGVWGEDGMWGCNPGATLIGMKWEAPHQRKAVRLPGGVHGRPKQSPWAVPSRVSGDPRPGGGSPCHATSVWGAGSAEMSSRNRHRGHLRRACPSSTPQLHLLAPASDNQAQRKGRGVQHNRPGAS